MTEHESFSPAWVAALTELTVVEAGRSANAGSYSYKYADLGDVVKRTRPVLASHGLVVSQDLVAFEGGLAVETTVRHTSGETVLFGPLPFPFGRDAQATGSAITYHRRYALIAALGMAAGDDDDGAAAKPREAPAPVEVPGFRRSVIDAVGKLNPAEREVLRTWLADEGLPDRPSQMNEDQCGKVAAYITSGLPKAGGAPAPQDPGARSIG